MFAFSVSHAILKNTSILAKKQRINGASVFPFFCPSGQVKRLMMLLPDSNIAFMIPFKKGLAKVSWLGTVRLSMSMAELSTYSDFTREQVEDLYHYDPNWLLSHERFSTYGARALIQRSNCADYFMDKKVGHIRFSRDLSRLERFVMKPAYLNLFRAPSPETVLNALPPAQSQTSELSVQGAIGGWQLEPIWWSKGFQPKPRVSNFGHVGKQNIE